MAGKSYWFYLEPFVYVSVKGNDLLLYNTLTGKFLSYYDKPGIIKFILDLHRKENLYALKVSREFLRDNGLEEFTVDVSKHFMGDLIDVSFSPKKPFFMPANFDIQDEHNRQPHRTFQNVFGDSIFSITELTFFVNNRCDNNCTACKTAFKQFSWCTREEEDSELTLSDIKQILDQTRGCPIKNIDIIGGDLTQYPHLNRLVDLLCTGSFKVNYYFHFFHLKNGLPEAIRAAIQSGGSQTRVNVLVDFSTLTIPGDLTYLKELEADRLIFLIQRDEEIPILDEVITDLKTANISVQPYFNGDNFDFFKANVFTGHDSLSESMLDIGVIKARMSYNTLNYGKMFIKSNKNIYSNLNGASLGSMADISMEKAVISELSEHGYWLKVRRDVVPCSDCLFNSICPPLSNFEIVSGINNSCNIRKDRSA
jgi:pseudo-rSAM protein